MIRTGRPNVVGRRPKSLTEVVRLFPGHCIDAKTVSPMSDAGLRALHRPSQIEEETAIVVAEVGQIIREVGEIVAKPDLQMVADIA